MSKIINKKLIILGSGPAGYTAAIYASRANLNPILITGINQGGQLNINTLVENWPGDVNKLTGSKLMSRMNNHALKFNTKIIYDNIIKTDFNINPFILIGEKSKYKCKSLIIATGSSAKFLGIKSETFYKGKGLSSCSTCDGFFYKNKKVAIVGGGNSAIESALYLSKICKEVNLIHRSNIFRAEKILIDRLNNKIKYKNIILHKNKIVKKIIGNKIYVTGLKLKNKINNEYEYLNVEGIFILIGHTPNTSIFKSQLNLNDGYISVNKSIKDKFTSTSIKGIFAAGDVIDKFYKQAITAAGYGCMAALDAERYLNENEINSND
ncbi:MAG: thioredoxin-disulfide reductase [Enterobacterales bacterium]